MFLIQGKVHKIFTAPGGKDRKSGADYAESHKLQLICEVPLRNGEVKDELFTMTIPGGSSAALKLQEAIGTDVTLPVGLSVSGSKITPFLVEL